MTKKRLTTSKVFAGTTLLLLVIPVVVFVGAGLYRGMGIAGVLVAVGEQYSADKTNLLVVSLLGLAPMLLITIVIVVRHFLRKPPESSAAYALGGSIPVLIVTAFVNLEYWPSYLPARQFMGFPHGLEFVIGPLVFAPVGVLLGFLVTWSVRKTQ